MFSSGVSLWGFLSHELPGDDEAADVEQYYGQNLKGFMCTSEEHFEERLKRG